ncbi:MAG: NADH-quinone oxidoreductase subunit N [Candidatus Caenarcaniphilales bacterium]|nr:NADH-quinone oxidoreductase subunit N [Candidatus Caenarcaniphilales bacterium]
MPSLVSYPLLALLPEISLTVALLFTLMLSFSKKLSRSIWLCNLPFLLIGLIFCGQTFLALENNQAYFLFKGTFVLDGFALLLKGLILLLLIAWNVFAGNFFHEPGEEINQNKDSELLIAHRAEFQFLTLALALGSCFLVSAYDFILAFIALETISLSSIALIGLAKLDKMGIEAALKYLLNGAIASAFFLFALSLIYGLTYGETNFAAFHSISPAILNQVFPYLVFCIALLFLVLAVGYKLSLAPFHWWAPDVYNGASLPATTILATISKIAALGIFVRFGMALFQISLPVSESAMFAPWWGFFAVLAILSMVIGNLVGARQLYRQNGSLKRLLAYSSIAQIGYIMTGIVIGSERSITQGIFYLVLYMLVNLAAFLGLMKLEEIYRAAQVRCQHPDDLNALKGLVQVNPALAVYLAICFASLAGVLPSMVIAKFLLVNESLRLGISSVLPADLLNSPLMAGLNQTLHFSFFVPPWLNLSMSITLLISSLVAIFYYFTLIKLIFIDSPLPEVKAILSKPQEFSYTTYISGAVCALLALSGLVLGLFPELVGRDISTKATQSIMISAANPIQRVLGIEQALNP